MSNVNHFAVPADDPERARTFYEATFGWRFESWGPPEFWNVHTGGESAILGALERRPEHPGVAPVHGYICTIAVDSIDAAIAAIESNGGRIVVPTTTIPGVGQIAQFTDTEGNLVSAMQYE